MAVFNRAALLNAFTPSHEVVEPKLFAGRHDQVKEVTDALQSAGQIPLIYGDRGLGKTSLAIQAQLIAMGQDELLNSMNARDRVIPEESAFMVFYVTCTDEVDGAAGLIQLLINALEDIDLEGVDSSRASRLVDRTTRKAVSLKLFQLESMKTYRTSVERIRYSDLNKSEQLLKTVRAVEEALGQQRILFIIDELDRAGDLSGFASFLHSVSGPALRFMLIGVAQNIADLHLSHPSIDRSLAPVTVPRMTRGELADLVERAMSSLNRQGIAYSLSEEARARLINISGGFPWFVHVVGQQALAISADSGSLTVSNDHVTRAIRRLTDGRFAQQFAGEYQNAVRGSASREKVLRVFAYWPRPDIPTSDAYAVLRGMGVANAAVYKGHLNSEQYGAVLAPSGYRQRGLLRFRNEMFRQYVFLRPSIHGGIDVEVEAAMRGFEGGVA